MIFMRLDMKVKSPPAPQKKKVILALVLAQQNHKFHVFLLSLRLPFDTQSLELRMNEKFRLKGSTEATDEHKKKLLIVIYILKPLVAHEKFVREKVRGRKKYLSENVEKQTRHILVKF